MQHPRTLQPADQIAHYRVVGPLGAGGMGEVYLATDQELERRVALKVLPPDLVRSEDRVRRFVQEAKSASSLNHPNIITIYEIGQDRIRSSSGLPDSGVVHYISMELVSGKTMAAKIHEEKTDLRTLIGYLAQAAEGIAKAHAVGIVHRDLKPSNIMVSDDGFAKVLDFGLAKLTESRGPSAPDATILTGTTDHTHDGAVVGTVHYMSPEQVQGKPVDHRSDIFSFGCILYEATTRRRPFVAESNVETMHKIIHDKPTPIEELNPLAPAELRRIVRRCMAKAQDQRLQSMKDLAIELREIADEYDALSASATSASATMGAYKPVAKRRPAGLQIALVAALVAAVGFGWWGWRRAARQPTPSPLETMRFLTTTSRGDVRDAALSTDGRYVAYIAGSEGRSTLRVRQVATGSDVEVLPDAEAVLESPSFSPDGNYVFYLKRRPNDPSYRALMSIPSLGGQEQERAFDVDSRVTFSPDGQQAAFIRGFPQRLLAVLIVRDLASGTERELATIKSPVGVSSPPSWSPDGKRISLPLVESAPELRMTIALVDVGTGKREDYLVRNGAIVEGLSWLSDGKGFVLSMSDLNLMAASQLFLLTYPGKQLSRMTNDFNRYENVTVGSGEEIVASVRESQLSNIYAVPPNGGTPRALTSSTNPEQSPFVFTPTRDGVAYGLFHDNRLSAFTVSNAGGPPKHLQTGNGHVFTLLSAADFAVYALKETDRPAHVWRVGLDGAGARQLTDGAGEALLDVSPDGRMVVFTRPDSTRGIWTVSTEGGEPRLVSAAAIPLAAFSPDGAWLVTGEYVTDASGMIRGRRCIAFPSAGGEPRNLGEVGNTALDVEWGPDSRSMTFLERTDPVWNVYEVRSGGTAPAQRTRLTGARITDHSWSPDGRALALVRRAENGDNLWVAGADGSEPHQVTQFDRLDIFQLEWSPSGEEILLRAGTQSRDVVMIRSFR